MTSYTMKKDGETLRIGFAEGVTAGGDQIVKDANNLMEAMIAAGELAGGACIKLNGPATLGVACVLSKELSNLYAIVGVFDPKLGKYIVTSTTNSLHPIGSLID